MEITQVAQVGKTTFACSVDVTKHACFAKTGIAPLLGLAVFGFLQALISRVCLYITRFSVSLPWQHLGRSDALPFFAQVPQMFPAGKSSEQVSEKTWFVMLEVIDSHVAKNMCKNYTGSFFGGMVKITIALNNVCSSLIYCQCAFHLK